MTLPGSKASTPFKTMDIKTALLSSASRKRKATSPQVCKDEPKNKKLSVENGSLEHEVEVLDEVCGITVTLQPSDIDSGLGDCKENKDINTAKKCLHDNSKENKLLSPSKEEKSLNELKKSYTVPILLTPDSSKLSDNDIDLLSDKSKKSDDSSCDDLDNSVNVSLNTSELSVTGEDNGNTEKNSESEINNESLNKSDKIQKTETKEKIKKKRMTTTEAKKKAEEREKKQKEKLLKKQELENKKRERQLEKEQKLKEKMLRKEREEIEKKERERIRQEKKEQEEKEKLKKQQEKEEKAKIKQMQLEVKLEEKKRKEEMKLKKEEELKKAEDEKKAKLEKEQKEKEKQERAKAAFAKFFRKAESNNSAPPIQTIEKEGAFLPFQVSDDMTLAPVVPPAAQERFDKKQLDHYLELQDGKELYLEALKSGIYKDVRRRKKNRKLEDSDVIIIDKNAQAELGLCPKLLQFCENVRPPYWGTWRKKSINIHGRNPFGQDEMFDYSVDSDDEWDEGGPGESLSGTENEDESEDDYEVDNEFFVPHGYLSDEEEKKEDDDEEVNDPEKQKALLKLKLQEFEMERKKKTTELKPIILGCYFVNVPVFQDSGLQKFLQTYYADFLSETPIPTTFTIKNQQSDCGSNTMDSPKSASNSNSTKKKKLLSMPEKAFPQLIRLVHGNPKNRRILAEEFQKFWIEQSEENNQETKQQNAEPSSNVEADPSKDSVSDMPSDSAQISLRLLNQTIREIAFYGKPPDSTFNKCCWWVHDNVREKYGLMDAPIPNQWKYVSQRDLEPAIKANCASIKGFLSSN